MQTDLAGLLPALADPVFDSQRVFRASLQALARPGTVQKIDVDIQAPFPLMTATAALALTLADFETPLWLQTEIEPAANYLRFHCGCPITGDCELAHFALIHDAAAMPPLGEFKQGTDEYPDRSTTLIIQVDSLAAGAGTRLRGPGIPLRVALAVGGLKEGFWQEWRDNAASFPRGVDILFAAGNEIVGLPRTTQMEL